MPMISARVNRAALGGRIEPECTSAANFLTSALVFWISAVIAGVGAR
jgi:hypothetical protein